MNKMNRYQEELCTNLCYLLAEDSQLLNDTIIEYVDLIDDNKCNDPEQYVNNNINELM